MNLIEEYSVPNEVKSLAQGEAFTLDQTGLSGSAVLLGQEKVLKIGPDCTDTRNEAAMLAWLQGRLPVPRYYTHCVENGKLFLLMGRLKGEMACAERYMRSPATQVRLLAEGLKRLWSVDITGCPVDAGLDGKLEEAARRVGSGLVDMEDAQPETYGPGGFSGPEALLLWLQNNRPEETPVLSHGDYCLPNVFFSDGQLSGFLDLSRAGAADRWCDIALCVRSLENNYGGFYGPSYPGLDTDLLFSELGLSPDREKIRYYILLDELF